jgi:hypothetical protein
MSSPCLKTVAIYGASMSVSVYQSAVLRLNKDKESVQKQIAAEQEKVGKLRRDAAKLREEAVKTKSATMQSSKRRQAESKERDLAAAEKRLAQLLGKKSKVEADLVRNLNSLQRVEDQARRQQETKDKRRREEELRHVQQVTREVERQSRLQASMPRGQLTVELVQRLPEEITVLFLAANPRDTSWIGLDEEIRLVEQKLRASEHRDAVVLRAAWAVRPDDLLQALNQHRPHVVHFAGHGDEHEIALQDADGNTKAISTDLLAQLMQLMIDNVRLVVFNTCESSKHARAVSAHVDIAIGMTAPIDDEAARVFAAQLYSAIGFGRSVQQAFEQARLELQLQSLPGAAIPELFVRPGVDPNQVFLVRP